MKNARQASRFVLVSLLVTLSLFAASCGSAAPAPLPTQAPVPTSSPFPTQAPLPPATNAPAAAAPTAAPTEAPAAAPTAAPTSAPAASGGDQITLTLWDIYPAGQPFRTVEDNAIARFNKQYPNVKVNVVSYAINDFKTKLVTSLAAGGKDFDIFQTWGGGQLATYARRGQVLDITSYMNQDNWKARFSNAALTFVTADNKVWGVPVELATVLVFYNTDIFKTNGVSVPKNFDDLVGACKTFKSKGIIPFALGMGSGAQWVGDFFYQYLVTRQGGVDPFRKAITRETGGTFEDPTFVKSAQMTQQMVDAGCFQDGFAGVQYASMRQLLYQGKAAMVLMGSWLPGQIATEAPDFMSKLDYFRFPVITGGKGVDTDVVGGTNAAYAIAKSTKYPAEAVALLKELSSEATANDVVTVAKRLSATKMTLDPAKTDPLTIRVFGELNNATAVQLYYDQSSTPGLAQDHLDQLTALMAKTTTPEQMCKDWEASAKKELQ